MCVKFVFLNIFLKNCEVATTLENRSHKIRYSDSVENGSIVFSVTGTVHLLIALRFL